jgi:hypothetical protein
MKLQSQQCATQIGVDSAHHSALTPPGTPPLEENPPPHPPLPPDTARCGPQGGYVPTPHLPQTGSGAPARRRQPWRIPESGIINLDMPAPQTSQHPKHPEPLGSHPLHAATPPPSIRLVPVNPPGACRSGWLSSRLSAPITSPWPFHVAMTVMVTSLTLPVACACAARHSPYITIGDAA